MSSVMKKFKALFSALRIRSWTKNLFVLSAFLFSRSWELKSFLAALAGTLAFCLLSSSVYIFNDIADRKRDRLHTEKKYRAIASGNLPVSLAIVIAFSLAVTVLVLSSIFAPGYFLVVLAYFLLQSGYSLGLKHVVILDSLIIAIGFVLRAMAGVEILQDVGYSVCFSPWLLICTFFLAVFLAFSKRRFEIIDLGENASDHRSNLRDYSPHLLDEMISIATAASVIGYATYTVSERTIEQVSGKLFLTIPFVVYGIFRYLYIIHKKGLGGSPDKILLSDKPLLFNILLWFCSVVLVLIFFPAT